jgi:hypothetical protein
MNFHPKKKDDTLAESGIIRRLNAGLAQLVERQLPKLNVASSNLVPRSIFIYDYSDR